LRAVTFAELWAARAATDGAARDVHIDFKTDIEFHRITHIKLIEYMPPAVDWNPKSRSRYLVRVHPVVAETRDIQKKLAGSRHGFVTAFFVVVAFVFVTDLIIRAVCKLVQP